MDGTGKHRDAVPSDAILYNKQTTAYKMMKLKHQCLFFTLGVLVGLTNAFPAKAWSLKEIMEKETKDRQIKDEYCDRWYSEISRDGYGGIWIVKNNQLYIYNAVEDKDGTPCKIISFGRIGDKIVKGESAIQFILEGNELCMYEKSIGPVTRECAPRNRMRTQK